MFLIYVFLYIKKLNNLYLLILNYGHFKKLQSYNYNKITKIKN